MSDIAHANATVLATSRDVYALVRDVIGPWFKTEDFRRIPKTRSGWQRTRDNGTTFTVAFECSSYGSASSGGNSFSCDFARSLAPGESPPNPGATLAGTAFVRCLLRPELAELEQIQSAINTRRPRYEGVDANLERQDWLGNFTRLRYLPVAQPYREGAFAELSYFGTDDVKALLEFVARTLPAAVHRFETNTHPAPIYDKPSGGFEL